MPRRKTFKWGSFLYEVAKIAIGVLAAIVVAFTLYATVLVYSFKLYF